MKTFVHQWHNQQSKKTTHGMEGNICKPYIWQWVKIQNIQKTSRFQQQQKQKKSDSKMSKEFE